MKPVRLHVNYQLVCVLDIELFDVHANYHYTVTLGKTYIYSRSNIHTNENPKSSQLQKNPFHNCKSTHIPYKNLKLERQVLSFMNAPDNTGQ